MAQPLCHRCAGCCVSALPCTSAARTCMSALRLQCCALARTSSAYVRGVALMSPTCPRAPAVACATATQARHAARSAPSRPGRAASPHPRQSRRPYPSKGTTQASRHAKPPGQKRLLRQAPAAHYPPRRRAQALQGHAAGWAAVAGPQPRAGKVGAAPWKGRMRRGTHMVVRLGPVLLLHRQPQHQC